MDTISVSLQYVIFSAHNVKKAQPNNMIPSRGGSWVARQLASDHLGPESPRLLLCSGVHDSRSCAKLQHSLKARPRSKQYIGCCRIGILQRRGSLLEKVREGAASNTHDIENLAPFINDGVCKHWMEYHILSQKTSAHTAYKENWCTETTTGKMEVVDLIHQVNTCQGT